MSGQRKLLTSSDIIQAGFGGEREESSSSCPRTVLTQSVLVSKEKGGDLASPPCCRILSVVSCS